MRTSSILPLALLTLAAACDGHVDPSTDGVLVVSTSTGGSEPDQDGYQLTIDGAASVSLGPTDTARIAIPSGRHALQLLGIAEQCAMAPGTALEVDVPSRGTIPVVFEIDCPSSGPRTIGKVRITTSTTGNVSSAPRYTVWYAHMGAWDYGFSPNHVGGDGVLLGSLGPNGVLVTELEASRESGGDPYWYTFELKDVPGNCSVRNPAPDPGPSFFTIPGDSTRQVQFAVTCTS